MDEYRQRESLSFDKVTRKKRRSRYLTFGLDNPLISIGIIGLVVAAVIWCVGKSGENESGAMSRDDIGTIATHDYKASRDFTFDRVDREATDRIREQRVAEVLPIYRWDRDYHNALSSKIQLVFANMRNGLREEAVRLDAARVKCETPGSLAQSDPARQKWVDALLSPFAGSAVFSPYLSICKPDKSEIDEQMTEWAEAHRDSFVQSMGYVVDDTTFAYLAANGFSESFETGLREIFDVVLDRMIVSTRQAIDGVGNISVQWQEGDAKRQKIVDKSEKTMISTLESSEMMFLGLMRESFAQAPDGLYAYFKQFVRPNMTYDETATERERQYVRDKTAELRVIEEYKKGQTIVARGNPIKASHYDIFEKMAQSQGDIENRAIRWISLIIVIGALVFMLWRSMRGSARRQKNRDLVYFASGVLVYAVSLRCFVLLIDVLDSVYHWPFSVLLVFPFAAAPMIMRIVVNRFYAYLLAIVSIVLTSLIVESQNLLMGYVVMSTMAGCMLMERPRRSNVILRYGAILGCISALVGVSAYLLRGTNMTVSDYWIVAFLGLCSGFISAGIVTIGLPIAESLFGYVTSNKLLELSNLEHPALKALFMEAPGTYQHSIMVGTLNEAAADAIGANSILARVGGYYHDIGKVKNAQYFAENQRGDNPHNRLNPNMSALILKTHERDGLEIAKKYKLPQDIRDFIATHHGTSRIEYFYQRAKDRQERVHEEDYRYPGPRPQTRETGICMVSDMVEAAVRSLPDKSPDKILVLVHKLINHKFTDGQFDECDLTLRDLNDIANALIGILNAFYHHRPEYPDQKKEREKIEAEKRDKTEQPKNNSDKTDNAETNKNSGGNAAANKDNPGKPGETNGIPDKNAAPKDNDVKPDKTDAGRDKSDASANAEKSGGDAGCRANQTDVPLSSDKTIVSIEPVKRSKDKSPDAQPADNPGSQKSGADSRGNPAKDEKNAAAKNEKQKNKNDKSSNIAKNSQNSDNSRAKSKDDAAKKGNAGEDKSPNGEQIPSDRAAQTGKTRPTDPDPADENASTVILDIIDEKEEVDALLKEDGDANAADDKTAAETPKNNDRDAAAETIQGIQDAYDLTFSSKVDVFKRS